MAITFRYVHVPRADGTLRKAPFIPIFVRTEENRLIKIIALVDSGADTTVLPKGLALVLGLKEENEIIETGGIGGKVKVKKSKIQFQISGSRESYPLTIPVLVLQDDSEDMPLILGRQGFFENFHITFRQNEEKITIKKTEFKKVYK